MESSPTPEPAYLNLPGWRCVPVYALPYANNSNNKLFPRDSPPPIETHSLLPANIPRDPRLWSRQHVYSWLEWCVDSFSLPPLDIEQFYMNGRGLCLLKKMDFRDRAPRSGDIIFNALQSLLKQVDKPSCNGSSLENNVSASLILQQTVHEKGLSHHQQWPRSISSDFHSMGHVVHENVGSNPINGTTSDVDSTTASSPDPSTSTNGALALNGTSGRLQEHSIMTAQKTTNGCHVDSGNADKETGTETFSSSSGPPRIAHLVKYGDVIAENTTEKINVRLLWDFLQQLLNDTHQRYNCCIIWKDKPRGVFKITDPHRLAGLWGKQKNHLNMNFDKMSRALRYYYRVRILQKEPGERHCYRFLRHPNELRHCKQRSLLPKEGNHSTCPTAPLECGDVEAVLDMSIKEEGSSPEGAD